MKRAILARTCTSCLQTRPTYVHSILLHLLTRHQCTQVKAHGWLTQTGGPGRRFSLLAAPKAQYSVISESRENMFIFDHDIASKPEASLHLPVGG